MEQEENAVVPHRIFVYRTVSWVYLIGSSKDQAAWTVLKLSRRELALTAVEDRTAYSKEQIDALLRTLHEGKTWALLCGWRVRMAVRVVRCGHVPNPWKLVDVGSGAGAGVGGFRAACGAAGGGERPTGAIPAPWCSRRQSHDRGSSAGVQSLCPDRMFPFSGGVLPAAGDRARVPGFHLRR